MPPKLFQQSGLLRLALGLTLAAVLAPTAAQAKLKVKSQGEAGVETRAFQSDDNDATKDQGVAAVARVQLDLRDGKFRARLRGFVRHDQIDPGRSAAFPEEARLEWRKDWLRVAVGWDMLTWTATEAFHPSDVVNSRYFDSNVEGFEKVGELMAQVRAKVGQGNITAYFMPYFTQPIFPSPRSRLSFTGPGVALGETLWMTRDGEISEDQWGAQWAVRAQQTIGDADVSLHFLQMQDRFHPIPGALVNFNPTNPTMPDLDTRIMFRPLTQLGGTYQQVVEGVIIKMEAAYRWFARPSIDPESNFVALDDRALTENRDHLAAALGLEYTIYFDNNWEAALLTEAQSLFFEGNGLKGNERIRRNLNIFQRDVMAGTRLAFNDISDSALLLFVVMDLENPEQVFGNVGYTRRVGEEWSLKTGFRFFHFPPDDDKPNPFSAWHKANQVYLTVLRHF